MKKKLLSLALTAVMVVMMGTSAWAANTDMPFTDVTSSHWAVQAVYYCWHNGIVEGVSETEYNPEGTLTTAQFITMMGRASHEDEIQAQLTSSDNWYSGYVRYLSNNGYLDGISTDDASLNTAITRQEMALIMCNVCKEYNEELDLDTSGTLDDVPDASEIGSAYKDAVEYCYYVGLLTGGEDGSFRPSDTLTRAEAATVLRRTCYWGDVENQKRSTLIDAGISNDVVNDVLNYLITDYINDYREENGLNRLENLWFMNVASEVRAEECSESFSHTRPDGSSFDSVYDDLYKNEFMIGTTGENIIMTSTLNSKSLSNTANELVEMWKESPGHNTNMLGKAYNYIGVGVYFLDTSAYGICIYSTTQFCARYGIITNGTCEWIFPE